MLYSGRIGSPIHRPGKSIHSTGTHGPCGTSCAQCNGKESIAHMTTHSHRFVEDYEGFIGFGLDRESDENTLVYYLQKISDDLLAKTLMRRLTDQERQDLFDMLSRLLKTHLSEDEYHRLFLKDRLP
jgi:hypothetical protein